MVKKLLLGIICLSVSASALYAADYDPADYDPFFPTLYFGSSTNITLVDQTGTMLPGNNPSSTPQIPGTIVQLIMDGGDNVISPPDASGQPTGDDTLLFSTRIGVGVPVFAGERGNFSVYCNFGSTEDKIYARIFNSADLATATYYGQTVIVRVGDLELVFDKYFTVDEHGLTRTDIPIDPQGDYVAAADAAGPYTGVEGTPVLLDASGTTDPDTDINSLVYLWDLDDDGIFDDAAGITVNYAWDDNRSGDIAVKASNTQSGTAGVAYSSVSIINAQPQIDQIEAQIAPVGIQFIVSAFYGDPGTADTHTVTVNWGDLTVESNIPVSGGVISLSHTYTTPDIYTVEITVYDDDGGSSSTMFDVMAMVIDVVSDPVVILPQLTRTEGITLSWTAQAGHHYEIWFTDNGPIDFDAMNPDWNLAALVSGSSYLDIGDSDGYDDTIGTTDDRLHPDQVDRRFYRVLEVAD